MDGTSMRQPVKRSLGRSCVCRCFDVTGEGDIDPEMLQYLRLYNLKDKDAFLLEAVFRQEVSLTRIDFTLKHYAGLVSWLDGWMDE